VRKDPTRSVIGGLVARPFSASVGLAWLTLDPGAGLQGGLPVDAVGSGMGDAACELMRLLARGLRNEDSFKRYLESNANSGQPKGSQGNPSPLATMLLTGYEGMTLKQ
jgi:hypothetical protein